MCWNDILHGSVNSIKENLKDISPEDYFNVITILKHDNRKSVQDIAHKLSEKLKRYEKAKEKTALLIEPEKKLRLQGYELICGIDEVGRGPLAGPVVCAAVIMPKSSQILYIDDSKKLSASKRELLAEEIKKEAIDWKIGMCSPQTIDRINILEATKQAMAEAVENLSVKPDLLLIDAVKIQSDTPVKAVIRGDATCYSIAAASILAKIYRDNLMKNYHELYPVYDFIHNMGYGTEKHITAIKKHGITEIHRKSFIKNLI